MNIYSVAIDSGESIRVTLHSTYEEARDILDAFVTLWWTHEADGLLMPESAEDRIYQYFTLKRVLKKGERAEITTHELEISIKESQ